MCKLELLRITRFKYKKKNQKDPGRGRKVAQSCKRPFAKAFDSRPDRKTVDFSLRNVFSRCEVPASVFRLAPDLCFTVRGHLTMQTEYGLPCSLIVGCNESQEKVGKTIAHVSIVYNVIICHEIVAPGSKFKQKVSFEM